MIFTGRQRLVNTLDDSYDSYEWTSQIYESMQVVSIGHSWPPFRAQLDIFGHKSDEF